MPRRIKRSPGRPTVLTRVKKNRILEIIEQGNHITTACAMVGIGTSTLYRWIELADDAEAQKEDPRAAPLTPDQEMFLEFRDGLRLARARAEMRAVAVIERSMEGGFVISEEPVQDAEGELKYGPRGELLWKRTYTQPDGRLAMNYLARSSPSAWGQNAVQRVELTGAGSGAAGEGEGLSDDAAVLLAEQLARVAARVQADRDREALELEEGVQDAEVVSEG